MANPVLHIKDSYYFEVPKLMWPSHRAGRKDFPDVWVSLDSDFQTWEFARLHAGLVDARIAMPDAKQSAGDWHAWQESHSAAPFDAFLEHLYAEVVAAATKPGVTPGVEEIRQAAEAKSGSVASRYVDFLVRRHDPAWGNEGWASLRQVAGDVQAYQADPSVKEWDAPKVERYNYHLSGKVLIPQPFGKLRNLYESESGFCVSRFMLVEVAVALILCVLFSWLAGKVRGGGPPRGRLWNLLETFVLFIRDQVAEPAIGHHDGHRFTPLLCTMFFFVLGCNLFGMLPWAGGPTGGFGVTGGLALVTFLTILVAGMLRFGPAGFFLNMVPGMDLPKPLMFLIGSMILVIEVGGLCIKNGVLAIRLLANMVAGHLVLLGVMGMAFGAQAAESFSAPDVASWSWPVTAVIALISATLFSCLELFVAFLQAYIFTFLSALFIGSAIHHH